MLFCNNSNILIKVVYCNLILNTFNSISTFILVSTWFKSKIVDPDYYEIETHIFFDTEHSVIRPLIGAHLEDIQVYTDHLVFKFALYKPQLFLCIGSDPNGRCRYYEDQHSFKICSFSGRIQALWSHPRHGLQTISSFPRSNQRRIHRTVRIFPTTKFTNY